MAHYKPSLEEIVSVIKSDIASKLSQACSYAKDTGEHVLYALMYVNALPTAIRMFRKGPGEPDELLYKIFTRETNIGFAGLLATGVIVDIGELIFLGYSAINGHPEYLAIPAVTNAISLGYEYVRSVRLKVIRRAMEEESAVKYVEGVFSEFFGKRNNNKPT